jgi:hypothetical protein
VDDLLERWRSGALRFVGVPSGAGSPVAIPPDACPSRHCLDIAGGSLSGPRGVFSNVRVRSTTSLPISGMLASAPTMSRRSRVERLW